MFFHYNQNNSGGCFDVNDNVHVNVIIEADSADDANNKAEEVGLYFGGEGDCECCGDRWCVAYGDGDAAPSFYGTPLSVAADVSENRWTNDGVRAYVYYADGRKEVVKY